MSCGRPIDLLSNSECPAGGRHLQDCHAKSHLPHSLNRETELAFRTHICKRTIDHWFSTEEYTMFL